MILPTDQFVEEKIAKSAATIALHNFQWHYTTMVLFNSTLIFGVDIFLRSFSKNSIVSRGIFYPYCLKNVRQYIMFGVDLTDIVQMLTGMQKHEFDNTGKYIVICQSKQPDKCNEVDIVNVLWGYKIINVVVINTQKEKGMNGFTYYQSEDCENIRPTNLKNWESCLVNDNKHCRNMYPVKLKNLHQCPIIVSTFNQIPYMNISDGIPTGADGDLLCIIAQAMNFSLVIMTPRIGDGWGQIEDNGTWSGSLADVYNDWANFSMTSASITLSRFTTFQMTTDYGFISEAWVTHPPEVLPSSLKLLRPFKMYVRILLGISFATVVLLKIALKSNFLLCMRNELNITIPYDIIFDSWKIGMGLPVTSFPTNTSLLCLAAFWIWYCFLIRTLYQVYLINALQTDVYASQFDTLEEAITLNYTVGGGLGLRDYYIGNVLVYDAWKDVEIDEIYPLLVKLSQGLKLVLTVNMETIKFFMSSNPDKRLYILPQIISSSPATIFLKKYSPLTNSINTVLYRLRESGIAKKIYMDHTGKNEFKDNSDNNIPIPISVVHYTGCYAILFTGWFFSSICFVVEKLISIKKKELAFNMLNRHIK